MRPAGANSAGGAGGRAGTGESPGADERSAGDGRAGKGELGALVRELDPVPEVPREAMWARIQEERVRTRGAARTWTSAHRVPRAAWQAGALLAATLVVGLGIARMTDGAARTGAEAAPPVASAAAAASPYHTAAVTHLVSTQALLATFPPAVPTGRTAELSSWAGKLLVTTRLLRDTPATEDVRIAALLADLEILLAQLAALPETASEDAMRMEVDIINDGIDRKNVLPRIRVATAGRVAAEP